MTARPTHRVVQLALAGALSLVFSATLSHARPLQLDDLFKFGRVSDPQISPDGRHIAYVVAEVDLAENRAQTDIWLLPATGGEPRRLTQSPKHDRHPRWSPDSRSLVFESNRDGAFQLYTLSLDGGEPRKITSLSTEANQPVWSPDGKHIAFISAVFPEFSELPHPEADRKNKEKLDARENSKVKARVFTRLLYRHWDSWVDDRRQHLFVIPVQGGAPNGQPRNLTPGDRDAIPTSSTFSAGDDFDFSPDGQELAYTATPTPPREEAWRTNHDLYAVDLKTGARRQLTSQPAADALPRYSPDGRWIAYRAQRRAGFEADRWELFLLERATGKTFSLTESLDTSVELLGWTRDSKTLVFEGEEKGAKLLWAAPVGGGAARRIVTGASNGEFSIGPDTYLAFTRSSFTHPAEVFTASLAESQPVSAPRPLTRVNQSLLADLTLNMPDSVTFPGAGGTPIQMWLVKPPGFDRTKKYPLVFWVHGGPQTAFLDAWSFRWNAQLWAAQGYVVALPNPRGSTGFGQKFTDEISGDWGGKIYTDLMNGLTWLEAQPYVDSTRMAAAGASFGGYMMNWFQGHTDKFKTLVTHCGVYNFATMYGTTEELWFDEWDHGIPWEKPDFEHFSPHKHAAKFKTPNLIIHNELDFRVPIAQGLDLFTTLQRKGVPSKFLYFPDEGHWVLKPQNSKLWHQTIFDWLQEYLRPTNPSHP